VLFADLFLAARTIVDRIGPSDGARRQPPENGMARLTFLVSNGLNFGEGRYEVLQRDTMGGPVVNHAARLMAYLMDQTRN
jgi:hypothetical protein